MQRSPSSRLFAFGGRLSLLFETVLSNCRNEFEYLLQISACACCFSIVHSAGRVHQVHRSAIDCFTLIACVHWLQRDGGKYLNLLPIPCFTDSPKVMQS